MSQLFNHVDVVVSSLDRSLPFNRDLLRLLGHVDEVAGWARDIESGPAEYDYSPGYYAVFFYDPDGLKLEVVHQP